MPCCFCPWQRFTYRCRAHCTIAGGCDEATINLVQCHLSIITTTAWPPHGDGDISMGAYSYIHTLSLASSYYFLRLYGDGNIENWHKECILCYYHRMHRMQYAIFDQNWEQNYLNSIAFLWIFLLSPVPTRHQKNISNIHACASPRIVTVSMSGVSCVGVFSCCNYFYYILIIFTIFTSKKKNS